MLTMSEMQIQQQEQQQDTIELFLSVLGGLEDVAVCMLPTLLLDAATSVHYKIGSGYLSLVFDGNGDAATSLQLNHPSMKIISMAIADLIEHPPLCVFAAYVSIGEIRVPRTLLFDSSSKKLLDFCMNGFTYSPTSLAPHEPATVEQTVFSSSFSPLNLRWRQGLSVLQFSPSTLSESLVSYLSMTSTPNMKEITESNPNTGTMKATPVRFRASFDRGDIQHRGVRSQDLAAALGGLTGDAFPSWKVNLKDYDVEIMGRWIQEDLEQVVFKNEHKPNITSNQFILPEGEINDEDQPWNKCSQTVQFEHTQQQQQEVKDEFIKIQVGIALPLALSTCPYRFRPLDGRTSLRIEIAYTLLALAAPKPGDVVVDTCSGVGTIPIVGAAHYPKSWFIGLEIQSANVEKAIHNAHEMMSKISNYRRQEQTIESFANRLTSKGVFQSLCSIGPSLFVGDARAVCWKSSSVDLVISDLPWGKRENSHVYNCKLYPRLMREIIRLLKVDGRAVLITGERKLLQRQLDAPFAKPFLKVLQKREISIGYKVMVFELLRI